MGGYRHLDDNELGNLPFEAFSVIDGPPRELDDSWLRTAEKDEQLTAMRGWFLARYCDPSLETPYDGREGGFQFIHGGPYDPADVLFDRFGGIIDDDLVNEVVEEMHGDVGEEWAPIQYENPYDDQFDFDARFDIQLQTRNEPLSRLKERLQQALSVLTLKGDWSAVIIVPSLALGAAVAALEAFLWETMDYWVENDETALRAIVTKIPALKEQKIVLGDIFDRRDGLKEHVKGYLQNIVWHRWERVAPLFELGLGIDVPSFKAINGAVVKRHDIVHRSGHDKTGKPTSVSQQEIKDLCTAIDAFAVDIDTKLASRKGPLVAAAWASPDFKGRDSF